jgi:molybdopterin converting factor small subunit
MAGRIEPLHVELFGIPRLIAGTADVCLEVPAQPTLSEALAALAQAVPALVGRVIAADGARLVPGYACNVNGLQFVRGGRDRLAAGDHLLIMSADAGG